MERAGSRVEPQASKIELSPFSLELYKYCSRTGAL
jgi:hypothetical protein